MPLLVQAAACFSAGGGQAQPRVYVPMKTVTSSSAARAGGTAAVKIVAKVKNVTPVRRIGCPA